MPLFSWLKSEPVEQTPNATINPITYLELLLILSTKVLEKAESKLGSLITRLGSLPTASSSPEELVNYVQRLYDLIMQSLGPDTAREMFESQLELLKKEHGVHESYFALLKILPMPVMESERLVLLSREELEKELISKIAELERTKADLEKTVQERTQIIAAERNKLSVTLSSISDAVVAVDLERKVVIFNSAAETLTGYKQAEILGQPIDKAIKIFDDKNELTSLTYCPIQTGDFEGVIFSKQNLKMIGRNGKTTYINLLSARIKEGISTNLGCILTLHDITKEKQLEEMKIDFVSMAVHELRTPLTSLKGYLHIFLRDYKKSMNQTQLTILTRLNIATYRLAGLVENLLNVSRIERGALTVNLSPTDWIKNIEGIISELIDQARDKKINLTFIKPKESVEVFVDKFRINEVLTNLLSNAINYTQPGGRIIVWTEKSDSEVITHIQDTGEGIPKEALPNLFTKFFRISGKLEQGSKGTGLGLYIAKSIIQMHSGRIWAESEFGKGSTFSFSFPLNKPQVRIKHLPDHRQNLQQAL